ncbi:MAG: BON domain-containing protein [Acidobacteriaceae bacterium]|nr:BON domain-containing protein [Acidobacteriaceae bacterium]
MTRNIASVCRALALAGAISLPSTIVAAQNHAPDNTAVNKGDRDRNASPPTADQAHNNMSDREMMSHIRRDVVSDKSLSSYGHNVKIVAKNGHVTLRGPVHSDDERRAIEEHARRYAGDGHVDNQLTVKEEHR